MPSMIGRHISRSRRERSSGIIGTFESLEDRIVPAVVFTQFQNPTNQPYVFAEAMAIGSDGNVWFANQVPSFSGPGDEPHTEIGFLNITDDMTTSYQIPGENRNGSPGQVAGIVAGPDGNLWFTDPSTNRVGFINPASKAITVFPLPTANSQPEGIAVGPEGNIWFTEYNGGKIGSINLSSHQIAEFPLARFGAQPLAITTGPDHNLWLTEKGDVAKYDPVTHQTTEYPISTLNQSAQGIIAGPDGNLWFSAATFGATLESVKLSKIDPATGTITSYPAYADAGLTVGPDGEIWFVSSQDQGIGEVNTSSGLVANYPIIPPAYYPSQLGGGIVNGGNNDLYFGGRGVMRADIIPADQGVITSNVYFDPGLNGTFNGGPAYDRLIYLDLHGDGRLDPGDPTAITDGNGYYMFSDVQPGTYTVRLLAYPGDHLTSPTSGSQTLVVTGGQIASPRTFGLVSEGAVLPIALNLTPFGTNNPDVSTAEVIGLYNLILGRAPDPAGQDAAVAALRGGAPLSAISSNLFHSAEYYTDLAISDYQNYLGRTPAPSEINAVVAALQGGLSAEHLAQSLLSSPEFNAIHPTNTDFIQQAYRDTVGREASTSEIAAVSGFLTSGLSRAAVIDSLLNSYEADARSVNGFYLTILDQPSDPSGLDFWVKGLQGGASLVDEAIEFFSIGFPGRANATVG